MYLTQEEALERVAERSFKNSREIQRDNKQRRNEVVDLFGVEYTRKGDASTIARFYISISPDMVYLERFEFKLIISSGSSAPLTASNFKVFVDGRNITPYLMAQYGGAWITIEGVYPSLDVDKNYDILEVASDFEGAGDSATASALTESGYKRVEVTADGPFQVTLVNYLKYSHMNR